MGTLMGKGAGRFVLMAALLFFAAGCNDSGMSGVDGSDGFVAPTGALSMTSFSMTDNDSFDSFGESGESDVKMLKTNNDVYDAGVEVATVHNPEPASMALMGLGLLGLLRRRKKAGDVKALLGILALVSVLFVGAPTASAAGFVNGGFEDGTFNGWVKDGGTNGGRGWGFSYPPQGLTFTGDPGKSAIVSPGTDSNTNNNLNMVYNGSYSARVNNEDNDWHMSTISQTFVWSDPTIYFAWAAVLQDPGHPSSLPTWDEQPFFSLTLEDVDKALVLYEMSFNATTMQTNPNIVGGVKNGLSDWLYTDWQNIGLDTSAYIGDTMKLTLLAADCGQGGHGGYAYLDGFSNIVVPPGEGVVPEPASMSLFGLGLLGLLKRRKK